LQQHNLVNATSAEVAILDGDGSARTFVRVRDHEKTLVVVLPDAGERGREEARSYAAIASHLAARSVPVPAIYAYDAASGMIAAEDLGDQLLYHRMQAAGTFSEKRPLYEEAIDLLLHLQTKGREGFKPEFCWDTPVFDRELMRNREADYFLREFWHSFLRQEVPPGLPAEFDRLADQAGSAPADFLLHRDSSRAT